MINIELLPLLERIEALERRVAELESKSERSKAFKAPSELQVSNYAREKGLSKPEADLLAEKFCSFYESKGWMIGKNKMKKWEMAVTTWLKTGQFKTQSETLKNKWL